MQTRVPAIVLICVLALHSVNGIPSLRRASRAYKYYSYGNIVAKLKELNEAYPHLVELYNAQDEFGVPSPGTCKNKWGVDEPCRQYYIRITNEATLATTGIDTRPEVFFSGCLHGDERIGPNTVTELAITLLENYDSGAPNEWLKYLVDTRATWIMPTANAKGYNDYVREENGVDPNRDFAYDKNSANCMVTTAARAINELWRRHAFQLAITYHGGMVMIAYEWGSPNHLDNNVSPDDSAQAGISRAMSLYGGHGATHGDYPYGTLNSQVYPVHGGMEDWGYAATWDKTPSDGPGAGCNPSTFGGYPLSQTQYESAMLRVFNILVETSDLKGPPESTLGSNAAVLTPNGRGDGELPRNQRLALTMVELVQPYVIWTGKSAIAHEAGKAIQAPLNFRPSTHLVFTWRVGGALHVDSTYLTYARVSDCSSKSTSELEALVKSSGELSTSSDSKDTEWQRGAPDKQGPHSLSTMFTSSLKLPVSEGEIVILGRAKVDQNWAVNPGASPAMGPQSHVVNARTKDAAEWNMQVGNHKVQAQIWWFSEPICLNITNSSEIFQFPTDEDAVSGVTIGLAVGGAVVGVVALLFLFMAYTRYVVKPLEDTGDSGISLKEGEFEERRILRSESNPTSLTAEDLELERDLDFSQEPDELHALEFGKEAI